MTILLPTYLVFRPSQAKKNATWLGNVLYDVASAAAIAMVLNRSIVYASFCCTAAHLDTQGGGGLAAVGAVRVAL